MVCRNYAALMRMDQPGVREQLVLRPGGQRCIDERRVLRNTRLARLECGTNPVYLRGHGCWPSGRNGIIFSVYDTVEECFQKFNPFEHVRVRTERAQCHF